MHIHLDLVGGLSGDMFIATMLDCFPQLAEELPLVMEQAGFTDLVSLSRRAHDDGTLTGTHFTVSAGADAEGHHHRHYSEIRSIIGSSDLSETVKRHALGIFHLIAEVEAEIHGKSVDSVAFHEVGAWDSIADIVCAAFLIDECAASWSVSRIPMGSGRVQTAHGSLPVPAPATARLLEGFRLFDDGIAGERVTPTGAAILKYLQPATSAPYGATLRQSGYGFGSKQFDGISNVVRALVFDIESDSLWSSDSVLKLSFEVDDQTAEQLGLACDQLRQIDGVLDVLQAPAFGKKGRQTSSVQVLASIADEHPVTAACFELTTTLGVRREIVERAVLERSHITVTHEGKDYRVKVAVRPNKVTAKVEIDDLGLDEELRKQLEEKALAEYIK